MVHATRVSISKVNGGYATWGLHISSFCQRKGTILLFYIYIIEENQSQSTPTIEPSCQESSSMENDEPSSSQEVTEDKLDLQKNEKPAEEVSTDSKSDEEEGKNICL